VAVVITGHADVDYAMVVEHSSLILDTRNVLAAYGSDKVVTL
jgi:UDP-N-acetyl-D-mannosaminuronate dehydrogenase